MKKPNVQLEPVVKIRKLRKQGGSYYIAIPPAFIKRHGLERGEKLPVICDHILKVVPCKES